MMGLERGSGVMCLGGHNAIEIKTGLKKHMERKHELSLFVVSSPEGNHVLPEGAVTGETTQPE